MDEYEHEYDESYGDNIEGEGEYANDIEGAEAWAVKEEQRGEKPWSEGMR